MAVTLALQVRAEWLGLTLGLLVWGLLTRRVGRVLAMAMAALAVIGDRARRHPIAWPLQCLAWRDPGPRHRSDRCRACREFSPKAATHASTSQWRELWWEQIWLSVHSTPMLESIGRGYGFDLFGLAPPEVRVGLENIRTPHSVFYFALGYTGWVGVVLFGVFQLAILKLLWRSFRLGGQPAGVIFWLMGMSMAFFETSFEAPYKAIPFYLLMGLSLAPELESKGEWDARPTRAQLLSAARR